MAGSAGKNDSIDSSSTVTSTGVPNVVTVLMKRSSPPSGARSRSGTATSLTGGVAASGSGAG